MKLNMFVDTRVRLFLKANRFILEGVIRQADDNGIIFETFQKVSYISLSEIRSVVPLEMI